MFMSADDLDESAQQGPTEEEMYYMQQQEYYAQQAMLQQQQDAQRRPIDPLAQEASGQQSAVPQRPSALPEVNPVPEMDAFGYEEPQPAPSTDPAQVKLENMRRMKELELKKRASRKQSSGMIMLNEGGVTPTGAASGPPAFGPGSVGELNQSFSKTNISSASTSSAPMQQSVSGPYGTPTKKGSVDMSDLSKGLETGQMSRPLTTAEKQLLEQGIAPVFDPNTTAPVPKPVIPDVSDIRHFVTEPAKPGMVIQCSIERVKTGLNRLYPTYRLYLDHGNTFLLAARKRKKNKSSNYLISMDQNDLKRESGNFMGKLRSNFVGTEFTVFDKGCNPAKLLKSSNPIPRQELGAVLYQSNILGSKGPRKMQVVLPELDSMGNRSTIAPEGKEEDGILGRVRSGNLQNLATLKNKSPKWNEQLQAYVLNFNGRVTIASVKNFQLVQPTDVWTRRKAQVYYGFPCPFLPAPSVRDLFK